MIPFLAGGIPYLLDRIDEPILTPLKTAEEWASLSRYVWVSTTPDGYNFNDKEQKLYKYLSTESKPQPIQPKPESNLKDTDFFIEWVKESKSNFKSARKKPDPRKESKAQAYIRSLRFRRYIDPTPTLIPVLTHRVVHERAAPPPPLPVLEGKTTFDMTVYKSRLREYNERKKQIDRINACFM
jgi:hypothetical protein